MRTARRGAAGRAGHDLLIEVADWRATITLADDPARNVLELTADSGSLRVVDGTGGVKALDDDDRAAIKERIDHDVLKRTRIAFRSTATRRTGEDRLHVDGELELAGATRPIAFDLHIGDDGHLTGAAVVTQSNWGIKPYSALFGALKVADDVQVAIDGWLPST